MEFWEEEVVVGFWSGLERVLEFVRGTEGFVGASIRAASSGDLVIPSMKRMKRSPYGSGEMGEMSFLS